MTSGESAKRPRPSTRRWRGVGWRLSPHSSSASTPASRGHRRGGGRAETPQRPGQGHRPGQGGRAMQRRSSASWRRPAPASIPRRPRPAPGCDAELGQILESLPNILDADVPEGRDESDNVVVHQHGEPPRPNFAPKQHFELGEALGLMDFAAAAKLAGARFTVLKGRAGPAGTRPRPVDADPPHGAARLCRDRRAPSSSMPPPCMAPASCRSSRTTCSRPPTAATSSRRPRCR